MLTEIETAALGRITSKLTAIKSTGIQKDARGLLVNPSVAAAALDGEMERINQSTYKQTVILSVLLTFKDLQGEEKRRKGINPLIEGIIQILLLQDFGLTITPLKPVRFRDVTTTDDYEAWAIKYLILFSTSYNITKQSDEEVTELLTIALNYFLKPGDNTADASDTVTISP